MRITDGLQGSGEQDSSGLAEKCLDKFCCLPAAFCDNNNPYLHLIVTAQEFLKSGRLLHAP